MPLYIHAVCEEPGCKQGHTYSFDYTKETYVDLLDAMKAEGWRFSLNKRLQPEYMTCPAHHDSGAKEPVGLLEREGKVTEP